MLVGQKAQNVDWSYVFTNELAGRSGETWKKNLGFQITLFQIHYM